MVSRLEYTTVSEHHNPKIYKQYFSGFLRRFAIHFHLIFIFSDHFIYFFQLKTLSRSHLHDGIAYLGPSEVNVKRSDDWNHMEKSSIIEFRIFGISFKCGRKTTVFDTAKLYGIWPVFHCALQEKHFFICSDGWNRFWSTKIVLHFK